MHENTKKIHEIKKAIIASSREVLDFDKTKEIFLLWLSQFDFPHYTQASNWEECLESFPDASPESERPTEGLKLRFLLKLFTSNHTYVISLIECFNIDAIGKGIISVHVNIDQKEYNLQKTLELTYKESFDNSLKAKQTLYVESFDTTSLQDSLTNCGIAILNNELLGSSIKNNLPRIKNIPPQVASFPTAE